MWSIWYVYKIAKYMPKEKPNSKAFEALMT